MSKKKTVTIKERPDGWALYDNKGLIAVCHRGYKEALVLAGKVVMSSGCRKQRSGK